MDITEHNINKAIYELGVYPALMFLKYKQDNEMYGDCVIVKKGIDSVVGGREWYLSTEVTDDKLKETYTNILSQQSDKYRKHYDENVLDYINKFKQLFE